MKKLLFIFLLFIFTIPLISCDPTNSVETAVNKTKVPTLATGEEDAGTIDDVKDGEGHN